MCSIKLFLNWAKPSAHQNFLYYVKIILVLSLKVYYLWTILLFNVDELEDGDDVNATLLLLAVGVFGVDELGDDDWDDEFNDNGLQPLKLLLNRCCWSIRFSQPPGPAPPPVLLTPARIGEFVMNVVLSGVRGMYDWLRWWFGGVTIVGVTDITFDI